MRYVESRFKAVTASSRALGTLVKLMLISQFTLVFGRGDLCAELGFKGECQLHEGCSCICFDVTSEKTYVDAAYFGELGYELMLFLPVAHYYKTIGVLRRTAAVLGSKPFYPWSPSHAEVNRSRMDCQGVYSHPHLHMPTHEFNFEKWRPPAYRQYFTSSLLGTDKPTLVVHNKYNMEWAKKPINFIDIPTLMQLFSMLKHRYQIVYIRPDPGRHNLPGFSHDRSKTYQWNDFDEIRREHPEVILFQDLLQQQRVNGGPGQSFNELQMMVHAGCHRFISVQGGSSILSSYFAGVNIVFAKAGREADAPDRELHFTYPKLGDQGNGTIVHVKYLNHLAKAVAEYML